MELLVHVVDGFLWDVKELSISNSRLCGASPNLLHRISFSMTSKHH